MNEINEKVYEFVESLVRDNLRHKYNGDYNSFMVENGMIILFVEQNKNVIKSDNVKKAILDLISNEEFLNIIDRVMKEEKVVLPNNDAISDKQPENKDSEIKFIPLEEAEAIATSDQDKEIYKIARKWAVSPEYSHNLLIGVKNNHLEPVIQDANKNECRIDELNNTLVDTDQGKVKKLKPVKSFNSEGFSNALILAFIIGSFIGIVFLNIYSRYMK